MSDHVCNSRACVECAPRQRDAALLEVNRLAAENAALRGLLGKAGQLLADEWDPVQNDTLDEIRAVLGLGGGE